ncbi:MAG: hypothetical protein R2722_12895 [Tessaracoccus sp.]
MFVVALLALTITVVIALALMAVVAISAGQFTPGKAKWVKVADKANEHLNAQGDTPRFLEPLDAVRSHRR